MTPLIIAKLPPHPRVASQPLVPDPPPHRTYQVEGLNNSSLVHLEVHLVGVEQLPMETRKVLKKVKWTSQAVTM